MRPPFVTPVELVAACAEAVADLHGVTVDELTADCRERPVARVRQQAMWLAHRVHGVPCGQVGRWWGRDHTTVLHACRTVDETLPAGHPLRAVRLDPGVPPRPEPPAGPSWRERVDARMRADLADPPVEQPGWRTHAKCLNADPEMFAPGDGEPARPAQAVCWGDDGLGECPVRRSCLAYALAQSGLADCGVWAGYSERERGRMRSWLRARRSA